MSELQAMNFRSFVLWVLLGGLTLQACASHGEERPCDTGRQAALRGESSNAIALWEKVSLDLSPKERLRSVMTCLRNSGVAATNADAARWLIATAAKSGGRAQLYVGMLYASGAGVPVDHAKAREYLERARDVAASDAAEMLKILDASEKSAHEQH